MITKKKLKMFINDALILFMVSTALGAILGTGVYVFRVIAFAVIN